LVELKIFLNDLVSDSPHLGRAKPTPTQSTTPAEDIPQGSDLTTIQWSGRLNVVNEARGQGLVEVEVAEMDVEAVGKLLQILVELTSTPSIEL
jgi:hypothetical protein